MDGEAVKTISDLTLKTVEPKKVNETYYLPQGFNRVEEEFLPETINLKNLEGLVAYVKANPDSLDLTQAFIVVKDYDHVDFYQTLTPKHKKRPVSIEVKRRMVDNCFGERMSINDFIINLKSNFVLTPMVETVMKLVSKIKSTDDMEISDNGLNQEVTVKSGITLRDVEKIPEIIKLQPMRSFNEIKQPEVNVVLRVHKGRSGEVSISLTESGDAWKDTAVTRIKQYLTAKELPVNII